MCDLDIPEGAVILNTLLVVEYMDPDGEIFKEDFSTEGPVHADAEEIGMGKALELIEWARASVTMPLYIGMVDELRNDDDDDEEEAAV